MPSFFQEGDTPRIKDSMWRITQKILGGGVGSSGSYASGGNFSGAGSPEGVVTAVPGATYVDTNAPGTLWFKRTGTGSTGWV